MAKTDKTDKAKLMQDIEAKIQELNLLLSTVKADRSRKPDTIDTYREQYQLLLSGKKKNKN